MPHRNLPETLGYIVADVWRLTRGEFERRIAAAGLGVTPGEARTLAFIARLQPVRQSVLAERLNLEAMTLSGYVDRLEARELVQRETDPADRRAKLVRTTEAAADVLGRIEAISTTIRRDAAAGFTDAEWEALLSGLKRVRGNFTAIRDQARSDAA